MAVNLMYIMGLFPHCLFFWVISSWTETALPHIILQPVPHLMVAALFVFGLKSSTLIL